MLSSSGSPTHSPFYISSPPPRPTLPVPLGHLPQHCCRVHPFEIKHEALFPPSPLFLSPSLFSCFSCRNNLSFMLYLLPRPPPPPLLLSCGSKFIRLLLPFFRGWCCSSNHVSICDTSHVTFAPPFGTCISYYAVKGREGIDKQSCTCQDQMVEFKWCGSFTSDSRACVCEWALYNAKSLVKALSR